MNKNYFYIILFFLMFSASSVVAQDGKSQSKSQENGIEGLSFYPNPVSSGKIYITTKNNEDKQITIFDILGKKVIQTALSSKELNISSLSQAFILSKSKKATQARLEN